MKQFETLKIIFNYKVNYLTCEVRIYDVIKINFVKNSK